ncbi:MAG: hypothetical protein F6K09_17025 [Merismopedia sp. SIO2A8]|nr:hypothetical protein [Merismopedia sp. SIO2A8]
MQPGDRVVILAPSYAAGMLGVVLQAEQQSDGTLSDRWLVQVEEEDMILSLPESDLAQIDE